MKRTGVWAIGGSALAVWAALYIAFWYSRSGCFAVFDIACSDAPIAWLERLVSLWWVKDYQELVAAFVALLAAIVVGRPVYIQLREARRQSSAAAIPNFRGIAEELESYLATIEALRPVILQVVRLLREYDTEDNVHRLFEHWPEQMSTVVGALDDFSDALQMSLDRGYEVDGPLERSGLSLTRALSDQLRLLVTTFMHSTSGADAEEGEEDLSDMAQSVRESLSQTVSDWVSWRVHYVVAVRARIRAAWNKIRFLEADAIGDR